MKRLFLRFARWIVGDAEYSRIHGLLDERLKIERTTTNGRIEELDAELKSAQKEITVLLARQHFLSDAMADIDKEFQKQHEQLAALTEQVQNVSPRVRVARNFSEFRHAAENRPRSKS
jgi:chromosome segregation ATPase